MNNFEDDDDDFDVSSIDLDLVEEMSKSISPMKEPVQADNIRQKLRSNANKPQPDEMIIDEDAYPQDAIDEDKYQPPDEFDDELDFGDSSDAWNPDKPKKSGGLDSKLKKKLIIMAVVVVIGVIVIVILSNNKPKTFDMGDGKGKPTATESIAATEPKKEEPVKVPEPQGDKDYTAYVELPEKFYKDTMVVSKYLKLDKGVCSYMFMGIPTNFKSDVAFAVDVDTYNSIANGAMVEIQYKVLTQNGKDYLTGVVVQIKKG